MTQLNPVLTKMWERRYSATPPEMMDYAEAHIEWLGLDRKSRGAITQDEENLAIIRAQWFMMWYQATNLRKSYPLNFRLLGDDGRAREYEEVINPVGGVVDPPQLMPDHAARFLNRLRKEIEEIQPEDRPSGGDVGQSMGTDNRPQA